MDGPPSLEIFCVASDGVQEIGALNQLRPQWIALHIQAQLDSWKKSGCQCCRRAPVLACRRLSVVLEMLTGEVKGICRRALNPIVPLTLVPSCGEPSAGGLQPAAGLIP